MLSASNTSPLHVCTLFADLRCIFLVRVNPLHLRQALDPSPANLARPAIYIVARHGIGKSRYSLVAAVAVGHCGWMIYSRPILDHAVRDKEIPQTDIMAESGIYTCNKGQDPRSYPWRPSQSDKAKLARTGDPCGRQTQSSQWSDRSV